MSFGERPPSYREPAPGPPQWNGPPPTGTPFGAPPSWQAPRKNDLPPWAVVIVVALASVFALIYVVGSAIESRGAAARAAAEAQRSAEAARAAAAQRAAFEPQRAEYERLAALARARYSAEQFSGLANIVRPFDAAYADRLESEASMVRVATSCRTQSLPCATALASLAGFEALPREVPNYLRSACGTRAADEFRAGVANLAGVMAMTEQELVGARATATCIEQLRGIPASPSVAEIEAQLSALRARRLLPVEPFHYTGGGGYGGGRGGGRCRDSRGRFTRCY